MVINREWHGKNKNKSVMVDLAWNYTSIIVLGVSSLLYNILLEHLYGIETVGSFNQAYSYYIVLSQFAVLGIHNSVLRYVSNIDEKGERWSVLKSGLFLTVITSCVVALLTVLIGTNINNLNLSDKAIMQLGVALPFFSLNKVYINYLNACMRMKEYAFFQAMRSILMVSSIFFFYYIGVESHDICLCFGVSEIILYVVMTVWCLRYRVNGVAISKTRVMQHWQFGKKIFLSNVVLELNTKVDVLCLGWFLRDDKLIGIYSYAIVFAEGFYQLYVVLRRNINPQLAKDDYMIERINSKKMQITWLGLVGSVLLTVSYAILCIFTSKVYLQGVVPLAIVLISIAFNGKYILCGNYWAQKGEPSRETRYNMTTIASNIMLNILLIPVFGIIGAAISTAISYFVFSFMLRKSSILLTGKSTGIVNNAKKDIHK